MCDPPARGHPLLFCCSKTNYHAHCVVLLLCTEVSGNTRRSHVIFSRSTYCIQRQQTLSICFSPHRLRAPYRPDLQTSTQAAPANWSAVSVLQRGLYVYRSRPACGGLMQAELHPEALENSLTHLILFALCIRLRLEQENDAMSMSNTCCPDYLHHYFQCCCASPIP